MQSLPWAKVHAIADESLVGRGLLATQNLVASVALVGKERMSCVLHVGTNLMCAPRFQTAFQQCYGTETFQYAPMGYSMLARVASLGEDCHAQTVLGVTAYVASDGSFVLSERSPYESVVQPACGMVEELLAERSLCLGCLCYYQQTARILVYTVHQTHFRVVGVVSGVVLQMPCQSIDQCAAEVPASGMYHHAGRLVDE